MSHLLPYIDWTPLRTDALYTDCQCFPAMQKFSKSFKQGHNHGWKVEGDQGLDPNTGALAPRARPKAGLGVECGRRWPPPAMRVRRYHSPRKIFENSDAKSCILVTFCEISCFLKTTAKKLGNQYIVGPQHKSWGTSLPRSLRLLRLCV